MRRANAAIGSSVFFVAAPTVVAGVLPWWLTRWDVQQPSLSIPFRVIGVAAIVVGTGVLVLAFVRFVVEGSGTPAPVAPTEQLVVGGLYRYVRNPMYLAVEAIILGQALVLGRLSLLWYEAIVMIAFVVFVRGYRSPRSSAGSVRRTRPTDAPFPRGGRAGIRGCVVTCLSPRLNALHNIRVTTPTAPNLIRCTQTTSRPAGQASEQCFLVALTGRGTGIRDPQRHRGIPPTRPQLQRCSGAID
jgi:protein-S-isoprenylcysteine O-methyltransferase Ste14